MYIENWRNCTEYEVHGEAREVCILGSSDTSLNVCKELPKLSVAKKMLFFNHAYLTVGKQLELHIGVSEEIHYIIKGKGVFHHNDETLEVSEGDTIYIPAKEIHGLENTGLDTLEYLVMGTVVD